MKTFFPLLGLLVAPFCFQNQADAAIDPSIIPADSRWVLYADLNALRSSTVGKELVAAAEKAQAVQAKGPVGIDFQKVLATVGTATAYGSNFSKDPNAIDGAIVLQGTPDLRKIAESLLLQATISTPEGFAEVKDLPFPAYSIHPQKKDDKNGQELIVAFPPEPIVIASKSRAQLLKARDTFRDHKGALSGATDAPLSHLVKSAEGAYFFATSVVPSDTFFPEDQPQARILKMSHSGSLSLGETSGKTFAHIELVASSEEMADKLMKILSGITAAMSLAETNDKQLAEFLNSASVSRDNETVNLNLSYSSERLAQMLRSMIDEHKPAHQTSAEAVAAAKNAELFNGDAVDQWQAKPAEAGQGDKPSTAVRTIEKVTLKNGAILSLGRIMRGGRMAKFERVEIVPVDGGTPLTFQTQFMTRGGPRNNFTLFQFPGADGSYNLKVSYVNDPEGKTQYSVSVRQPKAPAPDADADSEPTKK